MHIPDVVQESPFTWTPTRGNDIPPRAIPFHEGPSGTLYIARGLLRGELQIGTTSYAFTEGAWLRDTYGRSHAVFEYEVLTLASSVRFQLAPAQPSVETAESTPRWSVRRDIVPAIRTPHAPRPIRRNPGMLEPFPGMGSVREQPAPAPKEREEKRVPNDPPPYSSPIGGWIEVPKQADSLSLNQRETVQFKHLAQSKFFTLIDDSPSMQCSWSQTRAALAGMVDILSSDSEWEGVDVKFLNCAECRCCVKTRKEFETIFNSVNTWKGEKVMTTKVTQVFEESLSIIGASNPRPVVLLIVTDGLATDAQELFNAILAFCQKLNAKRVPSHMFRIHILQMGDDRRAVKPLHDFRDRMTQRDRERCILNVVSYHRGRGLLNAQNIVQLLTGLTYIPVEDDPDLRDRQPPQVTEAQFREVDRIRAMGRR